MYLSFLMLGFSCPGSDPRCRSRTPYLSIPASALIVEPLVDVGIVLPGLVRQEHAVYGDVVVLLGKKGGEQPTILSVLAVSYDLHELPDGGLVLSSNRPGIHRPPLSARAVRFASCDVRPLLIRPTPSTNSPTASETAPT